MKTKPLVLTLIASLALLSACGERPQRPPKALPQDTEQTTNDIPVSLTSKVAHLVTDRDLSGMKFKVRRGNQTVMSECDDSSAESTGETYRLVRRKCEFGQRSLYVISEAPLAEGPMKDDTMEFDLVVAKDCESEEHVLPQRLNLSLESREKRHLIGFGVKKLQLPALAN